MVSSVALGAHAHEEWNMTPTTPPTRQARHRVHRL